MAEFIRAQIFGTTFEITSRLVVPVAGIAGIADVAHHERAVLTLPLGTRTCSPSAWAHSVWFGKCDDRLLTGGAGNPSARPPCKHSDRGLC